MKTNIILVKTFGVFELRVTFEGIFEPIVPTSIVFRDTRTGNFVSDISILDEYKLTDIHNMINEVKSSGEKL